MQGSSADDDDFDQEARDFGKEAHDSGKEARDSGKEARDFGKEARDFIARMRPDKDRLPRLQLYVAMHPEWQEVLKVRDVDEAVKYPLSVCFCGKKRGEVVPCTYLETHEDAVDLVAALADRFHAPPEVAIAIKQSRPPPPQARAPPSQSRALCTAGVPSIASRTRRGTSASRKTRSSG